MSTGSTEKKTEFVLNMVEHAHIINQHIDENFPIENREARQVICLAEEGGEFIEAALAVNEQIGRFVGAWRRYSGNARRTGTREEALSELADVMIVGYVMADILIRDNEPNMNDIIAAKLEKIYSRGWRDDIPANTVNDAGQIVAPNTTYIEPQQLTPGGPIHGGYTVTETPSPESVTFDPFPDPLDC